MPQPSQEQLIESATNISREPITDAQQVPFEMPFRSKIVTSTQAKESTQKNLQELERLTGQSYNIIV